MPRLKNLDSRIVPYVNALRKVKIDTDWSCEGHTNKFYPTGFQKPDKAVISGKLKNLSEIGKITEILTKMTTGCYCGTCSVFRIMIRLDADAGGIKMPRRYSYSVKFNDTIEKIEKSLKRKKMKYQSRFG